MDWFRVNSAGDPNIEWENLWFPLQFPLSIKVLVRFGLVLFDVIFFIVDECQ